MDSRNLNSLFITQSHLGAEWILPPCAERKMLKAAGPQEARVDTKWEHCVEFEPSGIFWESPDLPPIHLLPCFPAGPDAAVIGGKLMISMDLSQS